MSSEQVSCHQWGGEGQWPQSCKCGLVRWWHGAGGCTHTHIYIWCIYTVYRNKEPFKANYQLWRLPFLAGITLCFTSVVSSEKSFFYCISFLSFPSVSLQGSWSPSAHWLLPCSEVAQARLVPVSVACVPSISAAYPQVTLDCVNKPVVAWLLVGSWVTFLDELAGKELIW